MPQVDILSSSKRKQLQQLEALQTLQQSLQEACKIDPNKLDGLSILLQPPGPQAEVGAI